MSITNVTCVPLTLEELRQLNNTQLTLKWINGYVTCAICGVGILFNGAFLFFVITGMRQKILSSKLYLFLVNKSIGDLLASTAICVITGLGMTYQISIGLSYALIGVASLSYFSASLTYLALSLTKLVAVTDPLLYRRTVSSSLIAKVLICTWPVGVVLTNFGGEIDLVFIFNNHATCKERFQGVFAFISAAIFELFFLAVVAACAFVLFFVYKHERQRRARGLTIADSTRDSDNRQTGRSFYKLLAGFLVYAFCYFMALFRPLIKLIYMTDACEAFSGNECIEDNARGLIRSARILIAYSALVLFIFYRLVIDPVVNVVIDRKLYMVIKKRFTSSQSTVSSGTTEDSMIS